MRHFALLHHISPSTSKYVTKMLCAIIHHFQYMCRYVQLVWLHTQKKCRWYWINSARILQNETPASHGAREREWMMKKSQQKRHTFHLWNNVVAILMGIYIKKFTSHMANIERRQASTHHRPIVWKRPYSCVSRVVEWLTRVNKNNGSTVLYFIIKCIYSLQLFYLWIAAAVFFSSIPAMASHSCWVEWVSLELKAKTKQ